MDFLDNSPLSPSVLVSYLFFFFSMCCTSSRPICLINNNICPIQRRWEFRWGQESFVLWSSLIYHINWRYDVFYGAIENLLSPWQSCRYVCMVQRNDGDVDKKCCRETFLDKNDYMWIFLHYFMLQIVAISGDLHVILEVCFLG